MNPRSGKRDILTEMFEYLAPQKSKSEKMK